jgi:hypothetical protein
MIKTLTKEEFKKKYGEVALDGFNTKPTAIAGAPRSNDVEFGLSSYLKNFLNVPKNIIEEDYKAWQSAKDAVKHGSGMIASGDDVSQGVGVLEAGLGTVTPTLQAVFAPLTKTNEAIIPGEGFIPTVARGGLLGAELGAASSAPTAGAASPLTIPLGAATGAVTAAGMYGLSKIKEVPSVANYLSEHPEVERIVEGALALGAVAYGSGKTDVLNTPVSKIPGNVQANVGATTNAVVSPVTNAISSSVDTLTKKTNELVGSTKQKLAQERLNPQTQESATRLSNRQGIGETKVKNPAEMYDDFIKQEKQFKGDIKKDPALGTVGERTGNAFDSVVKQRRDAGAQMESQLKIVGNTPADLTQAVPKFKQNLSDQGLKFDPKTKEFVGSKTSKVTSSDRNLLNSYSKDLNALGTKPTIAELDAFISRVSQDLDVYKNSNNITGTTNGMRIVKSNLNDLRDSLVPTKNGVPINPQLNGYYNARQTYAKLSSFLDEGVKFLGKKTSSGDYAKDASMLKSSVQSMLNSGKKDWLIKLEELTGYPALDETVLALQAMKDSGNFRGSSLLQLLSDGDLPTSQSSIKSQIVDWAVQKGKGAVLGSPEQQTRAFLETLSPKVGSELSKSAGSKASTNTTPKSKSTVVSSTQTPKAPPVGSFEQIQESGSGWKPGMREVFDTALLGGNKAEVLRLLPQVPAAYKATFAQKIIDILSK